MASNGTNGHANGNGHTNGADASKASFMSYEADRNAKSEDT